MKDEEFDKKERDAKSDFYAQNAISGANSKVVGRYGSAVKEHFVAYEGVDNETGKELKKGLKSISQQKLGKGYEDQNLKQQAGFSAEVKEVARENAAKIINKDSTRSVRTDDIQSQKYGDNTIGGTNDQLYDTATIDKDGKVVAGSAAQIKFVGNSPKECFDKLYSKEYQKYLDAGADLEVPSDYYEGVKQCADEKAASLQKQIDGLKARGGDASEIQKKTAELKKVQKIKSSLKKSKVSNKEAVEARVNPILSTAKDVVSVSNRAGIEGAGIGATVGGLFSLVQNTIACVNGEKSPEEAAKDVALATGKGAVSGYATAFAGSALKGAMQNAKNTTLRACSKTNLPSLCVTATIEVTKTLSRYMNGEIDGVECLEELGEKGTGMVASAVYAAAGQMLIPVPIVGAMIGGMVGSMLNSACYGALTGSLKEAKLAHEERLRIEAYCKQAEKRARAYQKAVEKLVRKYLKENITVFRNSFSLMSEAIKSDNIDLFIAGNVAIQKQLGREPQFSNMGEFDALMASGDALVL